MVGEVLAVLLVKLALRQREQRRQRGRIRMRLKVAKRSTPRARVGALDRAQSELGDACVILREERIQNRGACLRALTGEQRLNGWRREGGDGVK